jgi:hypothetical protein
MLQGPNFMALNAETIPAEQVRKRYFLSTFYTKMIILPRQARDKHWENSKKRRVFLQRTLMGAVNNTVAPIGMLLSNCLGAKNAFLEPFLY